MNVILCFTFLPLSHFLHQAFHFVLIFCRLNLNPEQKGRNTDLLFAETIAQRHRSKRIVKPCETVLESQNGYVDLPVSFPQQPHGIRCNPQRLSLVDRPPSLTVDRDPQNSQRGIEHSAKVKGFIPRRIESVAL